MVNFGLLTAEIDWRVLDTPANIKGVSRLSFVTAPTLLNGRQPNFARCLAVSWAGTLYIYISGAVAPSRNFARCKIHFASKSCLLLHWQRYCTALEQSTAASAKLCGVQQRAPPIFGRAAITFGIGPHPSFGSRPSDHYFRSVCLFVCAEFFSAVFDPIWIKLGHMLHVRV